MYLLSFEETHFYLSKGINLRLVDLREGKGVFYKTSVRKVRVASGVGEKI